LVWRKVLAALVPPAVVIALTLAVLAWSAHLSPQLRVLVAWTPVILAGGALLAALHFNRSRAFFAILSIVAAWFALAPGADRSAFAAHTLFDAVSIFLPLNLMVFALINERGVFTRAGSFRFLLVFLEVVFVGIVLWSQSDKLAWLLAMPLFESALTRALVIEPPGLLVMLVALLLFHGRLVLSPDPMRAAFFGATVAVVLALYDGVHTPWTGALLGAAGLVFLVALLQTSWRMAFLDELTGLPGRRALEERLLKLDDDYVIAMVDVDHFKRFNDTWGHDAGDEVLRMVAARLAAVESGGRAYRYGGEEFTIVFGGCEVRDTLAALGALRKQIADETFVIRRRDRRAGDTRRAGPDDEREVRITISIGVAGSARGGATPHEVMRSADKALYRAKKAGRNQVCR
jgi:diguanylate cyclase (GGDEF)-like protein